MLNSLLHFPTGSPALATYPYPLISFSGIILFCKLIIVTMYLNITLNVPVLGMEVKRNKA